jgi:hypothetical protein
VTALLYAQHGAAVGVLGPFALCTADGPSAFSPITARRVVSEIERLRRTSHRSRLVYVYVVAEDANLPDHETRKIVAEVAQHVDAVIGIHEGTGFRASVVRGMITSINLLARQRLRPIIFASVGEAVEHLERRSPELGAKRLFEALASVRAQGRRAAA